MYIKIFISQSFTRSTLKAHFVAPYFVTSLFGIPLRGRLTGIIALAVLENVVSVHTLFLGVAFAALFCFQRCGH